MMAGNGLSAGMDKPGTIAEQLNEKAGDVQPSRPLAYQDRSPDLQNQFTNTPTTTKPVTNQERITAALDAINADRAFWLHTSRDDQNNGVVRWMLSASPPLGPDRVAYLNLTRSDADMADLLEVIAVLTDGQVEGQMNPTALNQAFPAMTALRDMMDGLTIRGDQS